MTGHHPPQTARPTTINATTELARTPATRSDTKLPEPAPTPPTSRAPSNTQQHALTQKPQQLHTLGDEAVADLVEASGYWHLASEHERERSALERADTLDDGTHGLSGRGAFLAYLLIHGHHDAAEPLLAELRRTGSSDWRVYQEIAGGYDAIGMHHEALRWLNIAVRHFVADRGESFDADLGDPEFQLLAERSDLRRRLGLSEDVLDQVFQRLSAKARAELDEIKRLAATVPQPRTPTSPSSGKPGRNEPCSCGSGRKYKKCCGAPRTV